MRSAFSSVFAFPLNRVYRLRIYVQTVFASYFRPSFFVVSSELYFIACVFHFEFIVSCFLCWLLHVRVHCPTIYEFEAISIYQTKLYICTTNSQTQSKRTIAAHNMHNIYLCTESIPAILLIVSVLFQKKKYA